MLEMRSGSGVVVLLSGGLDSTYLAEYAAQSGELCATVYVDYGHPAAEMERASIARWRAIHDHFYRHRELIIQLDGMDSMCTPQDPGARVVPGRNMVFASIGVNFAKAIGAQAVWLGANAADRRDYRDCHGEFAALLSEASYYAYGVQVVYPIESMSRSEIYEMAHRIGVRDVWSCYAPVDGSPCGLCSKCQLGLTRTLDDH